MAGQPVSSARAQRNDQHSAESASHLKAAWERHPVVRPEMLAYARALAADPGYPPEAMMKLLAQHLLSAPDPSSDQS